MIRALYWLAVLIGFGAGLLVGTLLSSLGAPWWMYPLALLPFMAPPLLAAREARRRD